MSEPKKPRCSDCKFFRPPPVVIIGGDPGRCQYAPPPIVAQLRSISVLTPTETSMSDEEIDRENPEFNKGVNHTVDLLATALGATGWCAGDGSEDYDEDLAQTLINILTAAGMWDKDEGAPAGRVEIERLRKEIGRAYRAVRGFYSCLSKGQTPSEAMMAYHGLTVGAAIRFVNEGALDGSDYFIGKKLDVLQDVIRDADKGVTLFGG